MPEIVPFHQPGEGPAKAAGRRSISWYALVLCAVLLAAPGCVPKKTVETARAGSVQNSYATPKSFCRFSMGDKQIGIPAPEGPLVKVGGDQLRQGASAWITPSENVFCVYEIAAPQKMRGEAGSASFLLGRQVVIVSALPEFMDESISGAQFKALRGDLSRSAGLWRDSAVGDFLRMTKNYYKDRPGFTHSMGVYHSTACSISSVRLIKEMDRRPARKSGALPTGTSGTKDSSDVWDFSALLANPDNDVAGTGAVTGSGGALPDKSSGGSNRRNQAEIAAEARQYFAGGNFTLSVRNLVYLRGKVFNIYYNVPVRSVDDISKAMQGNAAYMEGVAKNAFASGAALSGPGPRGGTDALKGKADEAPRAAVSPIV